MRNFFKRAGPWLLCLLAIILMASGILLATGAESKTPEITTPVEFRPSPETAPEAPSQLAFLQLKKGKKVPAIDVPALGKGRLKLTDFLGKVVILDFWSISCPPCLEVTMHLQKMYTKYGKNGFVPLGINLDPYPQMAKNFKKRAKLTYPIGFATDKVIRDYGGLRSIPQSFLVDQKGNLYRHFDGWGRPYAIQMEKDIKELLKIKD